jgi:murein DD-endopeptidase MepM/ murein hydrolase activator NlpD
MAVRPNVFPVQGGAQYTDSWGGARSKAATGGTGAHQGQDLFAAEGTPVVAVTDGIISKMGPSKIGGNRIWISGKFYYAHLKGFATGLKVGQRVKAGQVIGYVGTTGDAEGTPPHLHFGYDPNGTQGQSWANPYTMLKGWAAGRLEPETGESQASPVAGRTGGSPDVPQAAQLEFGQGPSVGPPMPGVSGIPAPASEVIPYREPGSASELWKLIAPQSAEGRRFLELSGGTDAG